VETVRQAETSDHVEIVRCIQEWWGNVCTPEEARERTLLLPKLFLQHFAGTSLIMEHDGRMAAFMVGFHSQDHQERAYAHFLGVDPTLRKRGVGRKLYTMFLDQAARAGRREAYAITTPVNTPSIAMHRSLGFEMMPGDRKVDGVFVHSDYDGPGQDRVCFRKQLDPLQ
jgi:N-acetylglutamate synthase-like GNAT family acetyltransferase